MAEFSDTSMERPPEQDFRHEFMEAKHVTKYLEQYMARHSYAGRTLQGRLVLGFDIERVEKRGGQWIIYGTKSGQ